MKQQLFTVTLLLALRSLSASAQTPESFFPHHIGDRWDYWHSAYGFSSVVLTRDSISTDGSHFLFYNGAAIPRFKIDTLERVVSNPTYPNSNILYQLNADSGFVWRGGPWQWAWVARVESVWVFGRRTVSKVFRYNPEHPDTLGWNYYYEEHHLARGFGKFYWEGEPAWVELLYGCIIAGDTFGTLVSVSTASSELPSEYRLSQNYPNPFNASTTIELNLPEATILSVRIYDVLGRNVATIVEGKLMAGVHRSVWDASGFPSGIYLCRLQANGNVRSIKMILTK